MFYRPDQTKQFGHNVYKSNTPAGSQYKYTELSLPFSQYKRNKAVQQSAHHSNLIYPFVYFQIHRFREANGANMIGIELLKLMQARSFRCPFGPLRQICLHFLLLELFYK